MTDRQRGLLLLCFDYSNVASDEFNDWYDTEHIPERERTRGVLNGRRWLGIANPRISVATYDLESIDALRNPEYLAISGANLSPWSKRVIGRCKQLLRFEGRQLLPGERLTDDAAQVLFAATVNMGDKEFPAAGDAYGVLASSLSRVPGVRSMRIFEGTNDAARFLELYELDSGTVLDSPEWGRAQAKSSPTLGGLRSRATLSLLCSRYKRPT
jgi:hypothetical protein